jgi:hypothetical protein
MHYERIRRKRPSDLRRYRSTADGHTWPGPKGTRFIHIGKDHPNADINGNILEHRKIMIEMLERPLAPGETVHHKNGVPDDNNPKNLELRVGAHPKGLTIEEALAWAAEIQQRYG